MAVLIEETRQALMLGRRRSARGAALASFNGLAGLAEAPVLGREAVGGQCPQGYYIGPVAPSGRRYCLPVGGGDELGNCYDAAGKKVACGGGTVSTAATGKSAWDVLSQGFSFVERLFGSNGGAVESGGAGEGASAPSAPTTLLGIPVSTLAIGGGLVVGGLVLVSVLRRRR